MRQCLAYSLGIPKRFKLLRGSGRLFLESVFCHPVVFLSAIMLSLLAFPMLIIKAPIVCSPPVLVGELMEPS